MRNNIRAYLIERLKRVKFIKTEMNRLVEKSITQNKIVQYKTRLASKVTIYRNTDGYNNISRQRLYCMINASTKITNKKFRLSRFSFNYLANNGRIAGLMKRGW